jgi:hypothetical protein
MNFLAGGAYVLIANKAPFYPFKLFTALPTLVFGQFAPSHYLARARNRAGMASEYWLKTR